VKNIKFLALVFAAFFIYCGATSVYASETEPSKTTAIIVEGATSMYVPFAGGDFGGGVRFEYLLNPALSLFLPFDYRWLAMSSFAESSKFTIITTGIGGKWYFSHHFWNQNEFSGFYIQGQIGIGYAHQKSDMPFNHDNKGWTFSLSPAFGYSHAFSNGIIIGGSISNHARGYTPPISQPLIMMHPLPELSITLGYGF
jgi:hypothetical protein